MTDASSIGGASARDFRQSHTCTGMLRCCIDFRFWGSILAYVEENFLEPGDFDLSAEAGGVKKILDEAKRESGIEGILISCRLHGMSKIVLVAHEDCGAYGGSKAFPNGTEERKFHIKQLRKAREIIEQILRSKDGGCLEKNGEYHSKEYVFLWAHFSDDGSTIEIERIAA